MLTTQLTLSMKKKEHERERQTEKVAREECNSHFWKFTKNMLGKGCMAQTSPAFTASTAHSFTEVYESSPHLFSSPSWMPSAPFPKPNSAMEMTPISEEELAHVISQV